MGANRGLLSSIVHMVAVIAHSFGVVSPVFVLAVGHFPLFTSSFDMFLQLSFHFGIPSVLFSLSHIYANLRNKVLYFSSML